MHPHGPDTWTPPYAFRPPLPPGAAPSGIPYATGFGAAGGAYGHGYGVAAGTGFGTGGGAGYGGAGTGTGGGTGYGVGAVGGAGYGGGSSSGGGAHGFGTPAGYAGGHRTYTYEERTYGCGCGGPGCSGGGYLRHASQSGGSPLFTERRAFFESIDHAAAPEEDTFPAVVFEPSLGTIAPSVAWATSRLAAGMGKKSALEVALQTPAGPGSTGAPRYVFPHAPDMYVSTFVSLRPFIPVFDGPTGGAGGVPPGVSLFHSPPGVPGPPPVAPLPPPAAAPRSTAEVRLAAAAVFHHWASPQTSAPALLPRDQFLMSAWTAGVYVRNTAARAVCPHGMTLQDYENWWVREWIRQQNPHQPRHH
ncbi:hypothetical protein I4F81_001529 [Pyropia yezoensis]|uniref:Uncharacterized protein n=1 Tax=Pyropia yezoensis TaxID=2788 RepID=A0ACC3BLT5_PYRYE|nr:hypothetical protein I4F81_001529 [Neopyropia yezoensis]